MIQHMNLFFVYVNMDVKSDVQTEWMHAVSIMYRVYIAKFVHLVANNEN